MKKLIFGIFLIYTAMTACNNGDDQSNKTTDSSTVSEKKVLPDIPVATSIEVMAAEALKLIDSTAKVEELGKGFSWAEGPVWVADLNALLFSDVPENKIYKWSEKDGLSVFLSPSGFTDTTKVKKGDGSNGLALDAEGDLVLCQHGDRRISSLKSGLQNPSANYIALADNYLGKKFNSPNDLAIKRNGDIYFTDPPFGLKNENDREIKFNGVYKVNQNGEVTKLTDTITMPNGIAFSPDEKTIYICNSDPKKLYIYSFQTDAKGEFSKPQIFFDATPYAKNGPGSPDGMKVSKNGNIFATSPGGVFIISPKGKVLGIIHTSKSTANLAFDADQKYLYMTTTDRLLRVKLK